MKFSELTTTGLAWGIFSVLPWILTLWVTYPKKDISYIRLALLSLLGFAGGILSTYLILEVNPLIWPEVDVTARRPKSLLTQTIHFAFIQAGMVEESFKVFFILLFGFIFARGSESSHTSIHSGSFENSGHSENLKNYENSDSPERSENPRSSENSEHFKNPVKNWDKGLFIIAGFTALGFAFIENSYYVMSEIPEKRLDTFLGRMIHSSNIHMLINLCFALFCLKSNQIAENSGKWGLVFFAFLLAVVQHGVVDFFLIPSSNLGGWIATAMFVGIWVWVVRDFRVWVLGKPMESL